MLPHGRHTGLQPLPSPPLPAAWTSGQSGRYWATLSTCLRSTSCPSRCAGACGCMGLMSACSPTTIRNGQKQRGSVRLQQAPCRHSPPHPFCSCGDPPLSENCKAFTR